MEERSMLFTKEDREKKVVIDGDEFTIMAILPSDRIAIEQMSASMQRGVPTGQYSMQGRFKLEQFTTIELSVQKGPPDWNGPIEWPIQDTLDQLYAEIESWSTEFQEWLKKNRRRKRGA